MITRCCSAQPKRHGRARSCPPSGWTPAWRADGGTTAAIDFPVVRGQRDPADGMAVRMTVFSLTLLLVPTLGLVWVRYVWQEVDDPGVTLLELLRRTGLIVAAGLLAYLVLRLAAAAVCAAARGVVGLDRRMHPWRY